MSLRTNYKDDVFSGNRKYTMINNQDGTVSFTDSTEYTQEGDTYGAAQINEANQKVNDLDANAYRNTDSAETAIADNDYFPFYDTSASAKKKTLWSNLKAILTNVFAIKVHNSNSASTYGAGNASSFGHVKLSDSYLSSGGAAANSVGASSAAVVSAYTKINNQLKANNTEIYMDYKNGRYGYNLSANRGADTFFPFSNVTISQIFSGNVGVSINNISYFYTTSAEYKYIIVYMEEKDTADINVRLSPTAGTEYFSYREGHDARIFEIWQNIPSGTRLGLSASRYQQEEKSGTMRGYVFGIST